MIENLKDGKKDLRWFEDNWFTPENLYPSYDKVQDRWVGITAKECNNHALEDQISSLEEVKKELLNN